MTSVEHLTEVMPSLDELAGIVSREHRLVLEALDGAVEHALVAGHALVGARRRVARGEWQTWIDSVGVNRGTASLYMRLATYEEIARDSPSIAAARKALLGLPPTTPVGNERLSGVEDDVKKLHAGGMSQYEIAAVLDISRTTVQAYLNPAVRSKRYKASAAARQRRQQAKRALAREERAKLAKQAGGGVSEAYSQIRRLAQTIDGLARNGESAEIRRAADLAVRKIHQAEDLIVKAIRP